MRLEDFQTDATVRGILPDTMVTVISVAWHGSDALTLVYRAPNGRVADEILYRHDEPRLEIVETGRPWSFDGDGALFRLVAEAHRGSVLPRRTSAARYTQDHPRAELQANFVSQTTRTKITQIDESAGLARQPCRLGNERLV